MLYLSAIMLRYRYVFLFHLRKYQTLRLPFGGMTMNNTDLSNNILNAVLCDAMYFYKFDVTTGIVEHDIIGTDGTNYSELMGFSAPYPFDEQANINIAKKVDVEVDFSADQVGIITRKMLLDTFAAGKYKLETVVYSDDSKCYYRLSYYMWKDSENDHIIALSACEDLTDSIQDKLHKALVDAKQAQQKILRDNAIISSISKMYFAIYRIDLINNFCENISSNDSVHALTNYEGNAQEQMNALCYTLVMPEYRNSVFHFFNLATVAERLSDTDTIEMEYHATDGNWHEARFIVKKRDEQGNVTHILYVTKVVSKEKQQELEQEHLKIAYQAAERANEAKTNFLFNMSHDIRTPMNAIIGYSQLIKRDIDKPNKILHYQEKMEQASEILLSLINNVLDMASIESGKMSVDYDYVNVNESVSDVFGVFEAAAKEKNINFVHLTEVEPKYILCDIVKIKQIYTNLISNAMKYTTPGGTVRVTAKELPGDSEGFIKIRTVFEDTGIGMSKEFLPHLFDSFTRERNTTIGKVAGTGLGMPIVKELVELLGGTIEVKSELGKGTTFIVTIPHKLAGDDYKHVIEKKMDAVVCIQELEGKSILLAEDNDLNAEIAITILEDMGFKVDHVNDGIVCVDKIQQQPAGTYDVVLMDIQMPHMNGYKAATVIRRLPDKEKSNIPIIAMTANAFEEDRKNAIAAGMNGHLSKPIEIQKLMETLSTVLK